MPCLTPAEHCFIDVTPQGVLVRFAQAELGVHNCRDLAEELVDLLAGLGEYKLTLDLREVEFLSNYVLMRLVVLDRRLQQCGGRLTVTNLRPLVYELFQVTQLVDVLDVRRGAG